jgi:hypothetical protein
MCVLGRSVRIFISSNGICRLKLSFRRRSDANEQCKCGKDKMISDGSQNQFATSFVVDSKYTILYIFSAWVLYFRVRLRPSEALPDRLIYQALLLFLFLDTHNGPFLRLLKMRRCMSFRGGASQTDHKQRSCA